jgi:hypothetical protein
VRVPSCVCAQSLCVRVRARSVPMSVRMRCVCAYVNECVWVRVRMRAVARVRAHQPLRPLDVRAQRDPQRRLILRRLPPLGRARSLHAAGAANGRCRRRLPFAFGAGGGVAA